MEHRTDDHLNGGGVVTEDKDGPLMIIIHTICRFILLPKCTDTIVNRAGLGPQVCFAPFNCLAYNSPNLIYS